MKKFLPILSLPIFLFSFVYTAKSQLNAGDIMFTGYNSTTTPDSYSFVAMVNIPAGTVISFTDNQWLTTNALATNEQTITWTSGVALPLGTQVTISGTTPTISIAGSPGSITGTALALSTSGDQVSAYRGTPASPIFISAIHMNINAVTPFGDCNNSTNAAWDPACIGASTNSSALPAGLTSGLTAVWMGTEGDGSTEWDNAVFTGCGLLLTTASQIRAALGNPANWNKTNTTANAVTLPSACTFFGVTAVKLINFTGKLNANNTTSLQWKIEDHANVDKFCIEKSTDGITFKPLSTVNASLSTTGTYYYTDNNLVAENNYYRIKIIELSGKIFYTNVVSISTKPKVDVTIYPNPVVNELVIKQDGASYSKVVQLLSTTGVVLKQINITSKQHSVNVKGLPSGLYYLKISEGKIIKIIKQ